MKGTVRSCKKWVARIRLTNSTRTNTPKTGADYIFLRRDTVRFGYSDNYYHYYKPIYHRNYHHHNHIICIINVCRQSGPSIHGLSATQETQCEPKADTCKGQRALYWSLLKLRTGRGATSSDGDWTKINSEPKVRSQVTTMTNYGYLTTGW